MLLSVIRDAGGTGGRYPPGLMLLFAGMPPLLTLSMGEAIAICSVVSASFLWMTCADSESLEGVEWANVWFVLASSALCVASCKLLDRLRFEHFLKRNALRLMKDEIEHRNRQLKIINARLLSSRRELEIYARAVSHDLRNPISAAFEALDLVDAHAADETWIRLARANLRQADSLIEELRAVAHSRQARTETTRVHLGDVVAEVLERARNDPRSNRAILTRRGVFCVVRGSRAKLVHALANLVDNALRATSHLATPAIEIEGTGETGLAVIAVMDNGCGMRREDVERIFEPSVAGIGAEVGDMGMGLALVKEIVESHGGWVTCESSVGNGSRFTVRLPRWHSAMGER